MVGLRKKNGAESIDEELQRPLAERQKRQNWQRRPLSPAAAAACTGLGAVY
jgi:hypothetical protein